MEYQRAWYSAHKERYKEKRKQWALDNKDKIRAAQKRWKELHPNGDLEKAARYRKKNPQAVKEAVAKWARKNKMRLREYARERCRRLAHIYAERASKRRALLRKAIPKWANQDALVRIFADAEKLTRATGIQHHVDHIVPLNSPIVCGLHVEANLRIISASENLRKGNIKWPDMP